MGNPVTKRRLLVVLVVALVTLIADQATKHWARSELRGQPPVILIQDYLEFSYHENPGSAFGLLRDLPGARYVLTGVGLLALGLFWRIIAPLRRHRRVGDIAYALIAGGALGNILDRIFIGRVVDFIVMHYQRKFIWPAYNVADIGLVAGIPLLIIVLSRRQEAPPPSQARHKGRKKKR